MNKNIVIFVVGHENWGKSKTLRALTNDNYQVKKKTVGEIEFFIRRMSNDDDQDGYFKFMKLLDPKYKPNLVAALCPNFERPGARTVDVLEILIKKGYTLNFWVIENQYGTENSVTGAEIKSLNSYGTVEIFSKLAESNVRAKAFEAFIKSVIAR